MRTSPYYAGRSVAAARRLACCMALQFVRQGHPVGRSPASSPTHAQCSGVYTRTQGLTLALARTNTDARKRAPIRGRRSSVASQHGQGG